MKEVTVNINSPKAEKAVTLKKADVWGNEKFNTGLVICSHRSYCPVFDLTLPAKAVTVRIPHYIAHLESEVIYWLEYVLGADCVTKTTTDEHDSIYLMAEYRCW